MERGLVEDGGLLPICIMSSRCHLKIRSLELRSFGLTVLFHCPLLPSLDFGSQNAGEGNWGLGRSGVSQEATGNGGRQR